MMYIYSDVYNVNTDACTNVFIDVNMMQIWCQYDDCICDVNIM